MQTQSSQECSTGTRGPGIPSPLLYWYPAHKDLCRSSSPDMPSIHPLVRLWQTQHHQHTRAAVRLTLFLRQSLSKCPRAPLCPGVQHQLNLSSRQSEEHWSHPISLHYETVSALLSYCCGTPREMLSHTSSGNKGPGWGWGWRRWGLPVPQTLLLSPFRAPQTSGGSFTLSSIQTKPAFSENKASHCVSAWLVQTLIIMTIMKYFNQGLDVCGSSLMYLASGKSSRAVICRINERLYKMHCKV